MSTTPAPRLDLYAAIHKALRLAMTDALARVGRLDVADDGQCHAMSVQLQSLLDLCRSHVDKEETHVHPALEARCAGVAHRIAAEHVEHLVAIDALEARVVAFMCAPDAHAAHLLYRQLALFVAENLEHMEVEETVHNAALWSAYSDDELLQVQQAILAAIDPPEMSRVLHWMLPALTHAERVGMLTDMRAHAPEPAFEGTLQMARQRLPSGEWSKLALALEAQACAA